MPPSLGTFTDLLLLNVDTGETWQAKVASTPEDQAIGVHTGINQILDKIPDGASVVLQVITHGTTVATNLILEGGGAKVGLIVTEGYRDLLQTRRSQVPGGMFCWYACTDVNSNSHSQVSRAGSLGRNRSLLRHWRPPLKLLDGCPRTERK